MFNSACKLLTGQAGGRGGGSSDLCLSQLCHLAPRGLLPTHKESRGCPAPQHAHLELEISHPRHPEMTMARDRNSRRQPQQWENRKLHVRSHQGEAQVEAGTAVARKREEDLQHWPRRERSGPRAWRLPGEEGGSNSGLCQLAEGRPGHLRLVPCAPKSFHNWSKRQKTSENQVAVFYREHVHRIHRPGQALTDSLRDQSKQKRSNCAEKKK